MSNHISRGVASLGASMAFFRQSLAPLGLDPVTRGDDCAGFGQGAFLIDGGGNNIEAVCHQPQEA